MKHWFWSLIQQANLFEVYDSKGLHGCKIKFSRKMKLSHTVIFIENKIKVSVFNGRLNVKYICH